MAETDHDFKTKKEGRFPLFRLAIVSNAYKCFFTFTFFNASDCESLPDP